MPEDNEGKTTSEMVFDFIATQPQLKGAIPFDLNKCICVNGFCTYDLAGVKIVLTEEQCEALQSATKK